MWQVAPEFLLGLVFSPIPALPAKRRFGWIGEVA